MAYKTSSTVFLAIKEAEFNKGGTFTSDDALPTTSDSSIKPEIKTIDRKIRSNSFIKCAALAGSESGSGTVGVEMMPIKDTNDLVGDLFYEVALGEKNVDKARVDYWKVTGDYSFDSDNSTITADDGSPIFDFVEVGDTLVVSGADSSNNQTYTVEALSDDEKTVTVNPAPGKTEDASNVTIEDTTADRVYEYNSEGEGIANLFKLGKPCGNEMSMAIKKIVGCNSNDSQSLILKGVVPSSMKLNFPAGDICTATFDLGGSSFETKTGDDVPAITCGDELPFVGKLAKFKVNKKTYDSKSLEVTISNTITDKETITSTGIAAKYTTAKEVKGSMTVVFKDYSEVDKFKNNENGKVYIRVSTPTHKLAIWFPFIRYTAVDVSDDNGVLMNKIDFQAYNDEKGEALYLGVEKQS